LAAAPWSSTRKLPKVARTSVALPERQALPEKNAEPVGNLPSRLWSMFDGFFLSAGRKSRLMFALPAWSSRRMYRDRHLAGSFEMRDCPRLVLNGFGDLTTLEINPEAHRTASTTSTQIRVRGKLSRRG